MTSKSNPEKLLSHQTDHVKKVDRKASEIGSIIRDMNTQNDPLEGKNKLTPVLLRQIYILYIIIITALLLNPFFSRYY